MGLVVFFMLNRSAEEKFDNLKYEVIEETGVKNEYNCFDKYDEFPDECRNKIKRLFFFKLGI